MEPALSSDTEFDAYWEEEARNPHRNRIRIGRQYQATIPPRLKLGEVDGRKLDQLETLAWRKENGLNDEKLDDYFFTSRALGLLARFRAKERETKEPEAGDNEAATPKNGICAVTPAVSDSKPGPKSRKEFEERKALLTAELVNLTAFVTSHHPVTQDPGCHCKDTDVRNEKWSVNEARLFSHALENYGKNFGAIKKALPWKPAQSLIDHYYKKGEEGGEGEQDDGGTSDNQDLSPGEAEPTTGICPKTDFQTSLQVACFTSSERFEGQSINWRKHEGDGQQKNGTSSIHSHSASHLNSSSIEADVVVGPEVKPVKAKPIFTPTETPETAANGNSLLGSLKFFMDGQLVLKLNANQQESDKKCHWVESQDTPKIVKSVKNKKYNKHSVKSGGNGSETGGGGETGSSRASEDTGDEESSDDESVDSESRSLPSPSDWRAVQGLTTRKCKVKIENNCQVPVATTAQLVSLSPTPGERTPKNHKTEAASSCMASAASSAKRTSDFSAFPFDDNCQPDKKINKKRLKSSNSGISNSTNHKVNHKTITNNNHSNSSSSSPGAKETAVFSRPEDLTSSRSGARGPPVAHSSAAFMDLTSKSYARSPAEDVNPCGLDLSVKPLTRSSSGSPSCQLQYSRGGSKSGAEKKRHASGSAAFSAGKASCSSGNRPGDLSKDPQEAGELDPSVAMSHAQQQEHDKNWIQNCLQSYELYYRLCSQQQQLLHNPPALATPTPDRARSAHSVSPPASFSSSSPTSSRSVAEVTGSISTVRQRRPKSVPGTPARDRKADAQQKGRKS